MDELTREIIEFRDERDWGQFHTPANLAAALSVEAGELLERFRWGMPYDWNDVCEEVADVLIYALTMCHELGVTPESIVRRKVETNAEKYPADEWRGRAW
jgi:NTP pyrophosphatase (non-canonical NTP hydrolase)